MSEPTFTEQAKEIVALVRAYTTGHDEAVELVAQALKTARSGGMVEATRQTSESMMRALDSVIGGPPGPVDPPKPPPRRVA